MQATNNKQPNNKAKEAHPKKTVHKIFAQLLQKTCESGMQNLPACGRREKLPLGKCKSDRGCRKLQGATVVVLIGRELELVWELNWFFQLVTCYTQPGAVTKVSELTRHALTLTGLWTVVWAILVEEKDLHFRPFQEFQLLYLEHGPHHRSLISFPECLKAEPFTCVKQGITNKHAGPANR
jgi:hypothetical protein